MGITISGENNNDRILASDGVIDEISGFNVVGVITATSFTGDLTGDVTGNLTGNVTGNINNSTLLLQTGGSERIRITGNNEIGIAGANYGTSGQVLTSGGSGSAVSWTTPAVTGFTNGSDNRVVTATSGSGLNGEANLTFDGSDLSLTGTFDCSGESTFRDRIQLVDSAPEILLTKPGGGLDSRILNDGSGNLIFGNGQNSDTPQERLRIDSTGRIGIGVDSFHDSSTRLQLQSPGSDHTGIVITAAATSTLSYIYFGDTADKDIGRIVYENSTDSMQFWTNNAEKLRINSNGDVTTTGQASFSRQNAGFTARAGDAVSITRASGTPLEINRTGSDGQMISLFDDNTQEAAISISSGSLQFGTPNSSTPRLTITSGGDALFSGLTTKNDARNNKGISLKSPAGVSFQNFGANGSKNWRIRPDDLIDWGTLEFSVSPSDNNDTDWPDAATDVVLTLKPDKNVIINNGKLGINNNSPNGLISAKHSGLSDNLYRFDYYYNSGNNASGYTASGITLSGTADNSNGDKHTTYINFNSRDPSLNGNHGASAYITMTNPDSQGSYGTGQLDFYIRSGAPYSFPNNPQAPSNYWMESLFRIQSNGVVKVPGELRVDRIVPDGGLPSSSFGGIIQIRWSANVDNSNYSSTSDVTMQTVNITPQRSSSRMLIHVVYPSIRSYTTGNTRNRLNHHIKRDGTEIYNLPEMPQWRGANFAGSNVEINHNVAFTHIDHPNTTNQVTYTATWQSADGQVWNTATGQMVMIVAELTG